MIVVDIFLIVNWLVPPVHRNDDVFSFLRALLVPLDNLKVRFYNYFDEVKYELTWNGQVCMLEELLNTEFDSMARGIKIEENEQENKVYLFNHAEGNEPTYIYCHSENATPLYLYRQIEYLSFFYILVPSSLVFDLDRFKALVDKYKLLSTHYQIIYY